MKNISIIQIATGLQIKETVFVIAATMILPVLVHLLPNINGNLSGAVLLPLFIAPMVAAYFFKKHVAIFAGIFVPLFNYLLMSRPAPEMVIILGFELVLFVLILTAIKNISVIKYFASPISFLLASLITVFGFSFAGNITAPSAFWITNTIIAIPGIILLAVSNLLILKFRQ